MVYTIRQRKSRYGHGRRRPGRTWPLGVLGRCSAGITTRFADGTVEKQRYLAAMSRIFAFLLTMRRSRATRTPAARPLELVLCVLTGGARSLGAVRALRVRGAAARDCTFHPGDLSQSTETAEGWIHQSGKNNGGFLAGQSFCRQR